MKGCGSVVGPMWAIGGARRFSGFSGGATESSMRVYTLSRSPRPLWEQNLLLGILLGMSGDGSSWQRAYSGSQRGVFRCGCGYLETKENEWIRHLRRCPEGVASHNGT